MALRRRVSLGLALAVGAFVHGLLYALGAIQRLVDGLGQRLWLRWFFRVGWGRALAPGQQRGRQTQWNQQTQRSSPGWAMAQCRTVGSRAL